MTLQTGTLASGPGEGEGTNLDAVNNSRITDLAARQGTMGFGKFREQSYWWLLLRRPRYTGWLIRERDALDGPARAASHRLEDLILDFDDEPIIEICNEPGCSKRAIRVTAREGYPSGTEFNCALHEATFSWYSQWGISGYRSALCYAEISCDGCSEAYQTIIARIAEAKGIPLPEESRP